MQGEDMELGEYRVDDYIEGQYSINAVITKDT